MAKRIQVQSAARLAPEAPTLAKPADADMSRSLLVGGAGIDGDMRGGDIEQRHLQQPTDSDDGLDWPIEKAPHYERNDRLDSAAGYLYEDTVEHVWDKHDASGLVHYTDAAFWDRMAGDLDERCHDEWDVEPQESEQPDGSSDSESESSYRKRHPRAVLQGSGLSLALRGAAGRIMRSWGSRDLDKPSSTLLAVVEGLQPNVARTGLGWMGTDKRRKLDHGRGKTSEWLSIGSKFDRKTEEETSSTAWQEDVMKSRGAGNDLRSKRLAGSFRVDPTGQAAERKHRIQFVPASASES
eukprot:TRINITY_DN11059_c1_g1_i1.p1 TRINITY_DN11059_c1_g1~~TRINITY_DN11059_c1_g1_i1.p1  ORF type:complete len:296 (-),score=56.99 TRINITY_DN11059_c1_g1_i1:168-1055(-)